MMAHSPLPPVVGSAVSLVPVSALVPVEPASVLVDEVEPSGSSYSLKLKPQPNSEAVP